MDATMQRISVQLNQQQLQLLDRAIAAGLAQDHASLIRRALRELAAKADLQQDTATKEGGKP